MVSPISTDSIFFIFSSIFEKNTHIKSQKIIPQKSILIKEIAHKLIAHPVTSHSRIIPRITRNKASDVPSLNILSHSNISASRRGAQTLLKIERTATGSVEEISAQNKRHTKKCISNPKSGKTKYKILETIIVDITTHTTARLHIVRQLRRSSL